MSEITTITVCDRQGVDITEGCKVRFAWSTERPDADGEMVPFTIVDDLATVVSVDTDLDIHDDDENPGQRGVLIGPTILVRFPDDTEGRFEALVIDQQVNDHDDVGLPLDIMVICEADELVVIKPAEEPAEPAVPKPAEVRVLNQDARYWGD